MKIVIATSRPWHDHLVDDLSKAIGAGVFLITTKEQLTFDYLKEIDPKYVFFPHWSHIISSAIYKNFECVIFHMTNLPFGRGGSPLQNLIAREIYHTKVTALKCTEVLDGGPIYLQHPLALEGSAKDIFSKLSDIVLEMMIQMTTHQVIPCPQEGNVVEFSRRTPEQSNIYGLTALEKIYDYIRMLDADGYPQAFIENDLIKYEFFDVEKVGTELVAKVRIKRKSHV